VTRVTPTSNRGWPADVFDPSCRRCPRLAQHLDGFHASHPYYHCAPVAPFGDPDARLLVVGLAPGAHGANATGRPFTGDYAGRLLFDTLFRFGWANQPEAHAADDGLVLTDCRITNAVKCLPPANKPSTAEIRTCGRFLAGELAAMPPRVIVALGRVGHDAVVRAHGARLRDHPFAHAALHHPANGPPIVDSYHCSRYNTQTGRLTPTMFDHVFTLARHQLG
jgi:uracil-DNA glycosylase family 4